MRVTSDATIVVVPIGFAVAMFSFSTFERQTALVSCLLALVMLAVAVVDARHFIVPDALSLPAIPAGLLASGSLLDPSSQGLVEVDNIVGAVAGGLCLWVVREAYSRVRGREGLGLGDVKLASVGGAWTGWQGLSPVLLLAATWALGLILALSLMRRRPPVATAKIPFGAFMAPSIWVIWALDAAARGL
jgi:leader peptidase (prepilin peptidase) / N-methyltransferase